MVRGRKPPEGHHAFYNLRQAHEMPAPGQHPDRRGASRGVWLARSMETERGQGTPPRLRWIAEHVGQFGLGAGIARRCQPSALQLAIVSPFQPLAELFGAVACL